MKQNDKFVRRSYMFEIDAEEREDNGGVIIGRPIVYESETDLGPFTEVIARGALNNTDLKDVRFLVNHDMTMIPLARSRNNNENSTMRLMPDDTGMMIRVALDIENNMTARELYSAVKRRDITGMSFLFIIRSERWENLNTEHPKRIIEEIESVIEVSAVTLPAYEDTEINARDKQTLDSARAALESARNNPTLESGSDNLILEKEKLRLLTFKEV